MAGNKRIGSRLAGLREIPPPDSHEMRAAICQVAPAVRRFLFGMCGNWHEAEDLAQGSLLKAWQRRRSFDGRSDATAWVFRIARNHWLDRLRRKGARPAEQTMSQTARTRSSGSYPVIAAARRELAEAVAEALATLPAEQHEALALRESEGLTFPQIATMLDLPTATVKSRVRYALLKLAEQLKPFRTELES